MAPSSRLLFYPSLPDRPEPPADLFAEGEVAEFQQRDHHRAAQIFRQLAQSPDRSVRAAVLTRLGPGAAGIEAGRGLPPRLRRDGGARRCSVAGSRRSSSRVPPAIQVLADVGQQDAARGEARALGGDLGKGRWKLSSGQYQHYIDVAASVAGVVPAASSEEVAIARAAGDLWSAWKAGLPPNGRRSIRASGVALLAVWRSAPERVAVWIASPDRLLGDFVATDPHVTVALSDAAGAPVAGVLDGTGRQAIRTLSDTRLPWTVHARIASAGATRSGVTRSGLITGGLGVMLLFLIAASYFIGRAVKQEMDLARLQADFVSAVSHEFRTPLAAMRQLSELLAAGRVPHQERRQQYDESLAGESRRLQRLVENLLNFGKLQAGARPDRLEPLDPRALVEQVVSEFQSQLSQPDCRIDVSGDDQAGRLLGDADAVALALHNLLDNAVKYAGADRRVSVSWTRQGERIALSVRDEGPGIATDERTRIFERFVRGTAAATANVRGTGIGLAMVRQVVSSHGGEVTVESSPGAGSVFTIWLPIANGTPS